MVGVGTVSIPHVRVVAACFERAPEIGSRSPGGACVGDGGADAYVEDVTIASLPFPPEVIMACG
jgi:hypothetical protein